jgi:hypothetical protein
MAAGVADQIAQAVWNGGSGSFAGNGTSGIYLWGAQLETGTTASAFQNIGTDKMTVFAGVRKLSDAAAGMLLELSASSTANTGTIATFAPYNAGTGNYAFRSFGTAQVDATTASTFAAPVTSVLSGIGDIAGDNSTLRVNGAQAATSATNQGTGNFGNYPLFIGARNSASLFFSGHLYSLIVRGTQSDSKRISSTETWVAGKTGITI